MLSLMDSRRSGFVIFEANKSLDIKRLKHRVENVEDLFAQHVDSLKPYTFTGAASSLLRTAYSVVFWNLDNIGIYIKLFLLFLTESQKIENKY